MERRVEKRMTGKLRTGKPGQILERILPGFSPALYLLVVVNLKTVTSWKVCPGFNSVDGKFGWFGEFG